MDHSRLVWNVMSVFFLAFMFISSVSEAKNNQNNLDSGYATVLDPQEAMELILSEPLSFVGMFYPANSESGKIPSCLFRNSKVTVMYTYCRKRETPALGMIVYSATPERGHITLYAEGSGAPVSQLHRSQYEQFMWKFFSRRNAEGYSPDMSAKAYADYYDNKEIYNYQLGCHVWEQYGSSQLRAGCTEAYQQQQKPWLADAVSFWKSPNANWYRVQRNLRQIIAQVSSIP